MLNQKELRLLIHHHHLAFVDTDGKIWLSSNIGRWIDSMAPHVKEIGLLLYETKTHEDQQDTVIYSSNVKLFSLGEREELFRRIVHSKSIKNVCKNASKNADGLLIRGITPHQYIIWKFTHVKNKAFFMIEEMGFRDQKLNFSLNSFFFYLLGQLRRKELYKIASGNTLLLANSPRTAFDMSKVFKRETHFVPTNSIYKSEFASFNIHKISTNPKLLYCGRLDLKKGLRELFFAMNILAHQGIICRLDLVAATKEPTFSKLVELASFLNISDQINWHGVIPYGQQLFAYYRQADIFLLPSYSEGFPKVFWEAAANCCPVIITSVGGIPTLLKNEEHALLIPPKDEEAIVKAIKLLLLNEPLRQQIATGAYEFAKSYTSEACGLKLVKILNSSWN